MDHVIAVLDEMLRTGRYAELERASRDLLSQQRFYLWHLYLIVVLLRTGRREEAEREMDDVFSYKFNIEDRAWPEIKAAFPDKFGGHYILSTMKPGLAFEIEGMVKTRWAVPFPMSDEATFTPAVDALLAEAVSAQPLLDRGKTHVTTFGSCFAANLARHLKATGIAASNLLIEESINSPLANRAFLDALARGGESPHARRIGEVFGADFIERARAQIAGAQVVVMTLGVAPGFFHRDSHALVFLEDYKSLLTQGLAYMRTPTVEETKAVIGDVLRLLRRINPAARLYVSVSPVPLTGTAELSNAVLADCVSKTTLRAALHEVLQDGERSGVFYWPSFEIVRWLGGHATAPIFGADDHASRHVSEWVVRLIVQRFSRHLFGG